MKHKVGDRIWVIPGYSGSALIAIQCTINEVDDESNAYEVDEPIGHSLRDDEIYDTREQAETELLHRSKQLQSLPPPSSLEAWRDDSEAFISKTLNDAGEADLSSFTRVDKPREDWFTCHDIVSKP